jgi:octaprenyl-diphosphate synthase
MKEYQQRAISILDPYPDSPYKDSLITMVNYVIEREK